MKTILINMFISFQRRFLSPLFIAILSTHSASAEDISVMSFNIQNYFVQGDGFSPAKSEASKKSIAAILKTISPDIFIAIEIGKEKSYADLKQTLKQNGCEYKYTRIIEGEDSSRHIALFSKYEPKEFDVSTDMTYKIKVKNSEEYDELGAQRGFIHALFVFDNGYRLHIMGAHLKSKVFNSRYNQTDMRRYEARLLKHLVNDILEKEPNANILVMGDLNDTYDSESIRQLRDENKKHEHRLYDLRPSDKWGLYWTHWWKLNDTYSRIDYALASYSILSEIDFAKSYVVHIPEQWLLASDHRPILISINTNDVTEMQNDAIDLKYPPLVKTQETHGENTIKTQNNGNDVKE